MDHATKALIERLCTALDGLRVETERLAAKIDHHEDWLREVNATVQRSIRARDLCDHPADSPEGEEERKDAAPVYDFPRAKPVAFTADAFGDWKRWPPQNGETPESVLYATGGVINRTAGPGVLLGGQTVESVLFCIDDRANGFHEKYWDGIEKDIAHPATAERLRR